MKLQEIFGTSSMLGRINQYRKDRETVPIPPKVNLWHATLAHNWPSIKQRGLIPGGVCQLFGGCDGNYVYMADRADVVTQLVSTDQPGISDAELKKSNGKGVIMLIDSTKLDPALLEGDPSLKPNWLNPIYTYRYAGIVPASTIVEWDYYTIEGSYYAWKSWRRVSQIKPGADKNNPVD